MANLYLTASQIENDIPYTFTMTGVRVYSLEEALYHCLHHWRNTSADFLSEPFIKWVEGSLGLGKIGARLREISRMESFSVQFVAFLSVVNYLPQDSLVPLGKEIVLWEKRQVWEKLAEQGDFWVLRGEGEKAYAFYDKALSYQENATLLNNAGVALMHMTSYDEAAEHFTRAARLEPSNSQLKFNLIEAYIFAGNHESAQNLIEEVVAKNPDHPEVFYFQAETLFRNKSYFEAIKLYEKAAGLAYDPQYIYRICDCYMEMQLYDKALAAMQAVSVQDVAFLRKQAGYYAKAGDILTAIKCIEKAIDSYANDVELWTVLARYHRMNHNLIGATRAVTTALSLSPENATALLEQARISKVQGRVREHQGILSRILSKFKREYREIMKV